jgi:cobalamin biosynthesis Mg chelatase CobN
VLALLAFACFPVLAPAETVYEQESTNLPGKGSGDSPNHKNPVSDGSSPKAESSGAHHDGGSEGSPGSSKTQNGASKESNPSSPGGGSHDQGKQGNGAAGSKNKPVLNMESAKPLGASPSSADDDSSSPLVPILIALAVLAAISVGAVLFRQRRGGSGSMFSPKAG